MMTFEEELEENGYLLHTNKGVSMMPLLRQNHDIMVLKKREPGKMKKYDAVLFKRDNGEYVMHRILKVRKNDYYIAGDYTISGEYVRDDQILAVLEEVIRDEKTIHVTDLNYRIYVHLWCDLYPVRMFLLKIKFILSHFYHSIRGD